MGNIKNKLYDWKDRLRKGKMFTLVITLVSIIIALTVFALMMSKKYRELAENSNNQAFYELIEYVNNTEKLLAKATISNDSKHGALVLTTTWKTATLAQSYLSRIPVAVQDLENANKFLNQVGDYCYVLSKKNINGEALSQEDLDNLTTLHAYSIELENTLNQLEADLYSKNIKWGALQKKGGKAFEDDSESLEKSSFLSIEEDLHQYTGLIYDGAFSENQSNFKGEGLTGEAITQEDSISKVKEFIGEDKIKEINNGGESENARISCYDYNIKLTNETDSTISIAKQGGHAVAMNNTRNITSTQISEEEAVNKGKEFLNNKGYKNMKETYYMNNDNILTVNYAYTQNDIVIYPDLIKVKIALDDGEILGFEATNYLNSHKENRENTEINITQDYAKSLVNPKMEIKGTNLAIIPTEFNTEVLCWEVKGTVKTQVNDTNIENDFLVYINANNGKEEDILLIVDTPNGTLTM